MKENPDMSKLKPIVTDTYDFPTLIQDGDVYVDKTALLHRLVSKVDGTLFFMSRPRRFGKSLNAEVESSKGRADAILETTKAVYIFEFKYSHSAKEALQQCYDRNYAAPYAADLRKPLYIGVNYNAKTSAIEVASGEVNGEVSGEVNGEVSGEVNGEVKSYVAGHPGCRRKDICEALQVAPRTLDRQIARLISASAIEFRGAPKTGGYYVVNPKVVTGPS